MICFSSSKFPFSIKRNLIFEEIRNLSNILSKRWWTNVPVKELRLSVSFLTTNLTLYRLLKLFKMSSNGVSLKIKRPSFHESISD